MTEVESLVEDILRTHHARLREEGKEIAAALARPGVNPALRSAWSRFTWIMDAHLQKEEDILFPNILALFKGQEGFGCGVEGPITVMKMEHQAIHRLMGELRALCAEGDGVSGKLLALLDDTEVHAAKEEDRLFPMALERAYGLEPA